jgi:hypothetical protein
MQWLSSAVVRLCGTAPIPRTATYDASPSEAASSSSEAASIGAAAAEAHLLELLSEIDHDDDDGWECMVGVLALELVDGSRFYLQHFMGEEYSVHGERANHTIDGIEHTVDFLNTVLDVSSVVLIGLPKRVAHAGYASIASATPVHLATGTSPNRDAKSVDRETLLRHLRVLRHVRTSHRRPVPAAEAAHERKR